MARKRIDCGPPVELSNVWMLAYIAQKCHTCPECGEKTSYGGAINSNGVYALRINGKHYSIRRVVFELNGGKLKKNGKIITTCQNHQCMNVKLLKQVTMRHIVLEASKSGKLHNLLTSAKTARTKRMASGLSQEYAERIRLDDRSSPVIAAEAGLSTSYVRAIKNGICRKSYTPSPFAGLMV